VADIDKLQNMRADVLHRLHATVEDNLRDLEDAAKNGRMSTVAWLARNLLELLVWSSFCAVSEDNSKHFVLDAVRDVHDAMNVPDDLLSTTFNFRAARAEAIEKATEDGFETLDESYTAVSKIAKQAGKGEEFKHINKLLSKFAHPTALSVIERESEANAKLKQKFYEMGYRFAKATLNIIEGTLKQ
jgi:hypothetical protein